MLKHPIKHTPKTIPDEVMKNFINEKGKLEVSLDTEVPAMQDFLIKLYYYPFLKYIYYVGKGRMFSFQLAEYANKVFGLTECQISVIIKEMIQYRLIETKLMWNSRILVLLAPAMNFFGNPLRLNTDILSLKRTSFLCEHINKFEPEKREFYIQHLQQSGIFLPDKLEHLAERLFIIPQKVTRNKEKDTLITFALLDISSHKRPIHIREKISVINSFMNPEIENVFFKLNFCCYNQQRLEFIQNSWNRESHCRIDASHYKGIEFTNLDIERFFEHQLTKSGTRRQKEHGTTIFTSKETE